MKIAIVRERADGETRVAATPETVQKLSALGGSVVIESGAGMLARFPDEDYAKAGATVAASAADAVAGAEIVLAVRRPSVGSLLGITPGALVDRDAWIPMATRARSALAKAGVTAVAMEFMPRITRAQVMDVLSSQANLAGYQAVIDAAGAFDRAMPMMMTAAGTVRPAKVFVMGAGVAGLQAIATAKRLGAVVTATDVRAAAGEQVESLGAKFIMTDALKDASGTGGYARELTTGKGGAGGTGRRSHRQAGHRHHHGADPRPAGAEAGQQGDGRIDGPGLGDRRSRGRARRQCRTDPAGQGRDHGQRRHHHRLLNVPGRLATSRQPALCAQPRVLPRDADRQEGKEARHQLGRRAGEGHRAHPRRRIVHPNIKVPGATPLEAPVAADPAKTGAAEKSAPGEAPAAAADDVTPAEPAKTGAADKKLTSI
jgi:NAD(P) transhydrogenase subunit alpha